MSDKSLGGSSNLPVRRMSGSGSGSGSPSLVGPIRMGQREVKSCNYCYKRKVKCDKVFPCSRCVSRGLGDLCEQQTVMVNGKITGGGRLPSAKTPTLAQMIEENKALHRKINAQEKTIQNLMRKFEHEEDREEKQEQEEEDGLMNKEDYQYEVGQSGAGINRSPRLPSLNGENGNGVSHAEFEHEHEHEHDEMGKSDYLGDVIRIYGIEPKRYKENEGFQLESPLSHSGGHSLDTLLAMVPLQQSSQLVRYHCQTLHWIHTVFHEPTFLREHDEWINSIGVGRPIVKTYDYYALYYAIIACSLYFMEESSAMMMGFSQAQTARYWFDTSVNCLQLCNFMVNPTMPVLQTICILPMIAHAFDASKYLGSLMHCALGLARDFDFHLATASTNPEKFGGNIQIELVRRIWWCLTITDSLRPEAHHPFHICMPTARTSPPANIDDYDLDDNKPIIPRPSSQTTRVTHLIAMERLAALFRNFNQSFNTKTTISARFKCVQEHDARLLCLLDDMPDLKPREDESYFPSNQDDHRGFDYRPWSRYLWMTALPPHRIMLYRWFLGKSYTDTRWARAREVCLEAARATLAARKKPVPTLFQKNWHVSSFTVIAGMVIASELTYGGHDTPERDKLRMEILEVINFFRSLTNKNAIINRGITLLENMVNEAEIRARPTETTDLALSNVDGLAEQPFDFSLDGFLLQGMMNNMDADLFNIFFQQDMNYS
uniref:Zn(2)-C6 fungal-type domain-containing protein n=1 Tax=Kwoniella bestiolae CBS 10118 TaxID=1296100 RepID=A0A1B9G3Q1_9TREE|nr:hypothetical protein I302_05478 [Kwoniella bestiolae CBS 10118]OCF25654.1 hypothetical protein I302_05478 [Kwoniella bestiolae CBS 10118]